MPVVIGNKEYLKPNEVRKRFEKIKISISESKLRRLAQLDIIPSISDGTLRLYDWDLLEQVDPNLWKPLTRGVKKQGQGQVHYSTIRRKAD